MAHRWGVRLLGGVLVERDGAATGQRSTALQTLLALLALQPGAPVAVQALTDELWSDGRLPQHPSATLHTRMTRLRAWLGGPPDLLTATAGAYTLHLEPEQVDLARFHSAADRALAPTTDPREILDEADRAVALWRGDPFPGLDAPRLDAARTWAQHRHRRLLEARIGALLRLGRALEAVDAAVPLAREYPEGETVQALAIEALHRAGRPREATETYLAVRRHLRNELGVEPGEELRAAYRRVLGERTVGPTTHAPRPLMVGREEPLAMVLDAVGAGDPEGRIIVVEGEAGIGKSTLLGAARHAAEDKGATTVAGAWDEDGTPMAAWFEALGRPPGSLGAAPGPWVRDRLVRLGEDAPLLVTLDDAHRADSASLGVLGALARTGVPAGVVVLVGARAPDSVARLEWSGALADLVRTERTRHTSLAALDETEVARLTGARLARFGPPAAARLGDLVWRRAGGHPLHAAALLDVLATQPDEAAAVAAAGTVPERLRAVLEHQVGHLPARTRRSLDALVVLRPIDLVALAAVLQRRVLEVADDLRPAVDAGLALAVGHQFEVRHELMAVAVHDAVPAATRASLHHVRLAALDAAPEGADPFVRLRHTLGAASLLTRADLARARLAAGIAAYQRRALAEALVLIEQAEPHLDGDPALVVHRGLVLGALGRHEEADDTLDAALDSPGADAGGDLVVLAAVGDEPLGTTVSGDPRRLARLHRVEGRPLPPGPRFELLAAVVREESLHGTARPELVEEMRELAAADGADPVTRARARALEARQLVEGPGSASARLGVASDAFVLADETDDPLLRLDATELLMTAALGAGRVGQARELRDVLAVDAERWHRPRLIWAAHLVESALLLAAGDVEAADAGALAGLQRGQELGVADAVQAYGVHLMIRHWLGGTADALVDLAAGAAANTPSIPAWSAAAAVSSARAGRRDAALEHLAEFRRRRTLATGRLFDRPGLCMAASAAFTLTDHATARLVRAELPADPDAVVIVGFGAVITGPATLFSGLAAWTLGDHDTARAEIGRAAALAGSLGWAAWTDAATRLLAVLDAPDAPGAVDLPLGLGH